METVGYNQRMTDFEIKLQELRNTDQLNYRILKGWSAELEAGASPDGNAVVAPVQPNLVTALVYNEIVVRNGMLYPARGSVPVTLEQARQNLPRFLYNTEYKRDNTIIDGKLSTEAGPQVTGNYALQYMLEQDQGPQVTAVVQHAHEKFKTKGLFTVFQSLKEATEFVEKNVSIIQGRTGLKTTGPKHAGMVCVDSNHFSSWEIRHSADLKEFPLTDYKLLPPAKFLKEAPAHIPSLGR